MGKASASHSHADSAVGVVALAPVQNPEQAAKDAETKVSASFG